MKKSGCLFLSTLLSLTSLNAFGAFRCSDIAYKNGITAEFSPDYRILNIYEIPKDTKPMAVLHCLPSGECKGEGRDSWIGNFRLRPLAGKAASGGRRALLYYEAAGYAELRLAELLCPE